jgi:hypothetical protein
MKETFRISPLTPESGDTNKKHYYFGEVPKEIFSTEEESIKSLEKLLSKRKTINTIEIEKEGFTSDDIVPLIDKGKAIWNSLNYPAQLTLNL